MALLATAFLLRFVFALAVPLDLIHDEAYYWDWARQLDWGYYSKPPMVAWLIALSTAAAGSTTWAVRLPAVVLSTVGLGFLYLLASRMYGARVGFWTVLAAMAAPGAVVGGLLMTIDAPLLCLWALSLYAVWRMLEGGPQRPAWVVVAGAAVGLGLLSKQTMAAVPALTGLFLLVSPEDRREIFRPAIWLFGLTSAAFLLPVAWWNAHHGWVTIEHTKEHFAAPPLNLGQRLSHAGEYLLGQGGLVSPVTALLVLIATVGGMLGFRLLGRRERFLLCLSGLPLLGVLALSLKQPIEPNWPAPFYLAALVLVTAWAVGPAALPQAISPARRWFVPGVAVGLILCAATYAAPFVLPAWGMSGHRLDPTNRLRGWSALGDQVGERARQLPRQDRFFLVALGRAEAAELAFYMPQQPRAYVWNPSGRILSQYDVWGGPIDKTGWDAVLVTPADSPPPALLAAAFDSVEEVEPVDVPLGGDRRLAYRVWLAKHLRVWPPAAAGGE